MKNIITTRNYFILMAIAYTLFAVYFLRGGKTILILAFALAIIAMILMAIKGDAKTETTAV